MSLLCAYVRQDLTTTFSTMAKYADEDSDSFVLDSKACATLFVRYDLMIYLGHALIVEEEIDIQGNTSPLLPRYLV